MANRLWQAILFGCIGILLGSSIGVAGFGNAVNGAIVFGPVGLIFGWLRPLGIRPAKMLLSIYRRLSVLFGAERTNLLDGSNPANVTPAPLAESFKSNMTAMGRAQMTNAEITEEILGEHLPYEFDMLVATYSRIDGCEDDILRNALIESFAIHARQLIDFFNDDQGVKATQLTTTTYAMRLQIPDSIAKKLNTQIAHLTYRRTGIASEKLGPQDRFVLAKELLAEVLNFDNQLDPKWRAFWALRDSWKVKERELKNTIQLPTTPSATGSISFTGPRS